MAKIVFGLLNQLSLDTLSRLKGIETLNLYRPRRLGHQTLDTLSRLKGIETVSIRQVIKRTTSLDTLSRLKGIETIGGLATGPHLYLWIHFPV